MKTIKNEVGAMNEVSNETIEEINNVLKGNLKDWNIKQYSKDNLWEESDLNGKIIVIWDGFYGKVLLMCR